MPTLAHALVVAEGASPTRTLVALHGILGRGGNLRAIARRVVAARPDWGVLLVDVREHGGSRGFAPPHTLDAAAADLDALDGLAVIARAPIRGIVGHSLGGKIALSWLARRPGELDTVVVLDATPSGGPGILDARLATAPAGSTPAVLAWLRTLPAVLPSREALVDLAAAAGFGRDTGEWLAMNLAHQPGGASAGYAMGIDLDVMDALFADYFAIDRWPLIEDPPGHGRIVMVVGDRAPTYTEEDRARLSRAAAAHPARVHAITLGTGHWVHVEDPAGTTAAILAAL